MRVRAKEMGLINGSRVRPGTVFDWDGKIAKWMEPLEPTPTPEAPAPEEPNIPRRKRGKAVTDGVES